MTSLHSQHSSTIDKPKQPPLQTNKAIESLYECSRALSSLVIDDVLNEVAHNAVIVSQASAVEFNTDAFAFLLLIKANKFNRIIVNPPELSRKVNSVFSELNLSKNSKQLGISGKSAVDGKTILAVNVNTHPDYIPISTSVITQISVPIKVNRMSAGVLSVACSKPDCFTVEGIRLLEVLAHYVSTAIARERLHNMEVEVATQQDKQVLLDTILREAAYFVGVSQGGLYEYHPDKGELELVAEIGQPEAKGRIIRVGEGVAGYLVHSGKKYKIVQNYSIWPNRSHLFTKNRKFDCVLAVLLRRRDGSIIGSFSLDCAVDRGWTEADAKILQSFAEHVEATYEKLDLIEHLQNLRRSAKAITSINLTDTPFNESVLSLVRLIKKILSCDLVYAYYYDPTTGKLNYPPISTDLKHPDLIEKHTQDEPSSFVYRLITEAKTFVHHSTKVEILKKEPDLFIIDEAIESLVAVPLRTQNQNIGIIFICFYSHHVFSREEIEEIELLSAQTAIAIQYIQGYERNQRFLSTASHELRAPLELIQGYLELIVKKSCGDISDEVANTLKKVLDQVEIQDQLLIQLLDLFRHDQGSLDLIYSSVNISNLIQELMESLKATASQKGITVSVENNLPDQLCVKIDEMRISQAIINLVRNAIEACSSEGRIELQAMKRYEQIIISIRDNGKGIAPSRLPSIFKRYIRNAEKASGLGIGLFLVKAWVEKHGGSVFIESEIGEGTTVTISLPIFTEGG